MRREAPLLSYVSAASFPRKREPIEGRGLCKDSWWGRGDLNSHALRHMILNHARLPFRHFPIAPG